MSNHQSATWLVTYDIADHKRLAKVFKCLKSHGLPVQYSVFRVQTSAAKMGQLMATLADLINIKEDDIRAYRLPERGWQHTIGGAILASDLWLP